MLCVFKYVLTASGKPPTNKYLRNKSKILLWKLSSSGSRFSNLVFIVLMANSFTPLAIRNSSKSKGNILIFRMLPIGIEVVLAKVTPNKEPLAI